MNLGFDFNLAAQNPKRLANACSAQSPLHVLSSVDL
jgi:hypothetical protein